MTSNSSISYNLDIIELYILSYAQLNQHILFIFI